MVSILRVAREFRQLIIEHDAQVAAELIEAYADAYQVIKLQYDQLERTIADARRRGIAIGRAWLIRQNRYQLLLDQILAQINEFARHADKLITQGQGKMVELAIEAARRQIQTGIANSTSQAVVGHTFHRVPHEALQNLIGTLQDGSPLAALLNTLGPEAASEAGVILTRAIAQGFNPRDTSRALKKSLGGNLDRALTIARTEQLRSHRTAAIDNYRVNSDVVTGWIWTAALDKRTCPVCIAMHGTVHTLDEEFGSHPNCRCTPRPIVAGYTQVGETGVEWFAKQDGPYQLYVLGPGKYDLYRRGKVALPELVVHTHSELWGDGLRERTLTELRAA